MKEADITVQEFSEALTRKMTSLPLITIYHGPDDYPDKYVARLWDLDRPTRYVAVAESLEKIQETVPKNMLLLGRRPEDDPCVLEAYV